jgi:hypothetical protein
VINSDNQFEKLFKSQIDITKSMFDHLKTYADKLLRKEQGSAEKRKKEDNPEFDLQLDLLICIAQFIRVFSRLDELAEYIGDNQGIDMIKEAMVLFPNCIQLQINSSACLANLASVESNRKKMLEDGSIKEVLANMFRFKKSPGVQAEICATLANLASHNLNADYIVKNKGCQMIISAMKTYQNQDDLLVQAFHALAGLAKHGKEFMGTEDFADLSYNILSTHQKSVEIVSAGWHCLGSMANSGVNFGDSKNKFLKMILESMRLFKINHAFQVTACFALAHLFFNNSIVF